MSSRRKWIVSAVAASVFVGIGLLFSNIHGTLFFLPLLIAMLPGFAVMEALDSLFADGMSDFLAYLGIFGTNVTLYTLLFRMLLQGRERERQQSTV
jgi:hypothetical protein